MTPANAPLQQSRLLSDALKLLGRDAVRLSLPHGEGFALRRRPFPALMSRGPVWLGRPDMAQRCKSFREAARQGVRLINAECPSDTPALKSAGFRQILTPAHIAELDLTQTLSHLRAGMQGKWRNRLTAAEASLPSACKLVHRPFDPTSDTWLLTQEAEQQKQRRYRALPPALVLLMSQTSPKAVRLFTLEAQASPRAAMLFLVHGRAASYHIGWSGAEGRRLGAHNLLLWHAIKALKADGIENLELGTLDTETAPSLTRFKLGSGAQTRSLGGTWLRLWPSLRTPR